FHRRSQVRDAAPRIRRGAAGRAAEGVGRGVRRAFRAGASQRAGLSRPYRTPATYAAGALPTAPEGARGRAADGQPAACRGGPQVDAKPLRSGVESEAGSLKQGGEVASALA